MGWAKKLLNRPSAIGTQPEPRRRGSGDPLPDADPLDLQYDGLGSILSGKRRYAVGLSWEPLQVGTPLKGQAERGDRSGYRRTLHAPFGTQVGFGSKDRQQRRGDPALVTAARRDLLGDSWVGAFRVSSTDRFWWVASMREGEVYEDVLFPDEASARLQLMEALDAPDWDTIIAPADWQIRDAVDGRIEQAFSLGGGSRLRPLDGKTDMIIRIVAIGGVLSIAGGSFYFWSEMKREEAERAEELRRMREATVRVDPSTYPWARAPLIEDFVDTCFDEIERIVYVVTGWGNGPLSCVLTPSGISVKAEWARNGGRISWLEAATSAGPGRVSLLADGERALLERQVETGPPPKEIPDSPWRADQIAEILQSRFQTLDLKVALRPRVRSLNATQLRELKAPVFNRHDLMIDTPVGVQEYARLLSDVPALVPEGLVYSLESGSWTLTAKIYHPPILPPPPR